MLMLTSASSASMDTYYVKPNNYSSNCDNQPCLTLEQYVNESARYLTTGSTFLFLSGNHSLQTQVNLTNISNLTLRGKDNDSNINILCTTKVAFRCENVIGFNVERLTFLLHLNQYNPASALAFLSCRKVSISCSAFKGSKDRNKTSAWAIFSNNSSILVSDCVFEGNTGSRGGAISIQGRSIMKLNGNNFTKNAGSKGGAISIQGGSMMQTLTGNNFTRNRASLGGAIYGSRSSIIMRGRDFFHNCSITRFTYNEANRGGAIYLSSSNATFENINVIGNSEKVVYISDSVVKLNGTNMFANNYGSTVVVTCRSYTNTLCSTVTFDGNNIIERNQGAFLLEFSDIFFKGNTRISNNFEIAGNAGAAIFSESCTLSLSGYTLFLNNSVSSGGAVHLRMGSASFYGTTEFINNSGETGSMSNLNVHLSFRGNSTFINNTAREGGVINFFFGTLIFFNITTFINNTAVTTGGAIYIVRGKLISEGKTSFINNRAKKGGALHTTYGSLSFAETTSFINNAAHENGGALFVLGTTVIFRGRTIFTSNSAINGGAMYLTTATTLSLASDTDVITSQNNASGYGGAIYHKDNAVSLVQCNYLNNSDEFDELPYCFLELQTLIPTITIYSYHDSAGKDGSFMYGGLLDRCKLERSSIYGTYNAPNVFMNILNITSNSKATRAIGSEPFLLNLCGTRNDTIQARSLTVTVHRGQTFFVPVVALSQGHIITSTIVTALISNSSRLELSQSIQTLPERCSNLTYRLYSTKKTEQLKLYPDGPCRDTGLAGVIIDVTLLDCPDGFTQQDAECVCEKRLQEYNTNCTIGEIIYLTRRAGSKYWMSKLYRNGSYQGLILYNSCPIEYCKTETAIIPLDDLDTQCDLNRSGILCGACATNYSLLLGSSQCAICSNNYLSLLIVFALAGIALIVFFTFLKLTVSTGMINSVILYANFIQVNRKLFFPINSINILTVFISWLNLDLGFKTCFFIGMDAYAQTWLQFAFPIYVWILISLIIFSSRYSITVSKLIGSNPVAVLATLLLMSYTKILKIIIEVFSSVNLDYPNGQKVTVWLKDANLPHLQWKHLFLTVVTSLVFIFIFLPYTFLLLLGHHLYRLPNRRGFRLLIKLKPLLDSYNAPYKIKTRYWTGFHLLVRCALYIVFSVNSLGDTGRSLLAIIITFTGIAILASGRIYRNFYVDLIEGSMYFNLIILSAGILAEVNKAALSYTLVGLALVIFIGIIMYHFHLLYTAKSTAWLTIKLKISSLKKRTSETDPPAKFTPSKISKTFIELREPILEN